MKNRRNYYRILQVQPDAPAEVIRSSFRTLMRELKQHPDLGGSDFNAAILNEAYGVLSNPGLRAEYDKMLNLRYSREKLAQAALAKPKVPSCSCPFCREPLVRKARTGESCPTCRVPLESAINTDNAQSSRRSIARMKRNGRLLYCSEWPGEEREARMVDLSPSGMRFLCQEKLQPGKILKLTGPYLRASAVVTNVRKVLHDSSRTHTIGVSFLAVEFDDSRGLFLSASA